MSKISDTLDKFPILEAYEIIRKVKNEKEAEKLLKERDIEWKTKKKFDLFGGRVQFLDRFRMIIAVWNIEEQLLEIIN